MKIVFLNYEYPPCGGGGGATAKFLAEALADRGHQVHVLTSGTSDLLGLSQPSPGVTVERIDSGRKRQESCSPWEMLRYVIAASLRLPSLKRAFKPDVLHCFFGMPTGAVIYLTGVKRSHPYLVSLLGGDVPGFLPAETNKMHWLTRRATHAVWQNATYVLPNSQGLARLARSAEPREYDVVPNGVDLGKFSAEGAIDSTALPLRLLFVGRLVAQKGGDILIDALHRISGTTPITLTVIGDGPCRQELEERASDLPGNISITWRGWVSLETLPDEYRSHHVLVLPSRFEGMASVMLQAMACGCAVISSDVFGASDVIQDGVSGYVVEIGDAAALASRIDELDWATLSRIRTASRIRVEHFSWPQIAKRVEELYAKSVEVSRRKAIGATSW
jgi:glycosyltransferase involved in cell wall biosynthesis